MIDPVLDMSQFRNDLLLYGKNTDVPIAYAAERVVKFRLNSLRVRLAQRCNLYPYCLQSQIEQGHPK